MLIIMVPKCLLDTPSWAGLGQTKRGAVGLPLPGQERPIPVEEVTSGFVR